jgi:hypothetical protein
LVRIIVALRVSFDMLRINSQGDDGAVGPFAFDIALPFLDFENVVAYEFGHFFVFILPEKPGVMAKYLSHVFILCPEEHHRFVVWDDSGGILYTVVVILADVFHNWLI